MSTKIVVVVLNSRILSLGSSHISFARVNILLTGGL